MKNVGQAHLSILSVGCTDNWRSHVYVLTYIGLSCCPPWLVHGIFLGSLFTIFQGTTFTCLLCCNFCCICPFVEKCCMKDTFLRLCTSENVFFLFLHSFDNLAGYRTLDWRIFSFGILNTLPHFLLSHFLGMLLTSPKPF